MATFEKRGNRWRAQLYVHGIRESKTFPTRGHSGTFDTLFRRARDGAGLTFHFHDLRREATTRLARKLNDVMKLSKITGHRDIKTLMRVYYAPDVEAWADMLD